MSAAQIKCTIVLDEPNRVYFGHNDPITGHILITCSPGSKNASNEIFGPLRIVVDIAGRAKSKIFVHGSGANGTTNTTIYRGRAPLFQRSHVIHDAPFRGNFGKPYKFPFSLLFPESVELGARIFENRGPSPYQDQPGHPLPPSMSQSYRGLVNQFECFVAYSMNARATMPGLEVQFSDVVEKILNYSPDASSSAPIPRRLTECAWSSSISNELLLPEAERPSGFKQKAKAMFSMIQFPVFVYNAVATMPRDLRIGEKPMLQVQIEHNLDQSTTTELPTIELRTAQIKVTAHTHVRAERSLLNEHKASGKEECYKSSASIGTSFKKEKEWTITVFGHSVPASLPPSFSTYNIDRSYELEVTFVLFCAGKEHKTSRRYTAPIHPFDTHPQASRMNLGDAGPSSSNAAPAYEVASSDPLPSYQDLVDSP